MKICIYCETEYFGKTINKKYCSDECYNEDSDFMGFEPNPPKIGTKEYTEKTCKTCGDKFSSWGVKQIYCNRSCYPENSRNEYRRNCKYVLCNREFITHKRNNLYCKEECCEKDRGRKHRFEKNQPIIKICRFCKKEFNVYNNKLYCGDECIKKSRTARYEKNKETARIRYHKNRAKQPVLTKKCKQCKEIVTTYKKNKIFCNKKCHLEWNKENRIVIKKSKPLIEKDCQGCGEIFTTTNRGKKFCNRNCYAKSRYIIRTELLIKTCPTCETDFETRNTRAKFCCFKCQRESRRIPPEQKTKPKPCKVCNELFKPKHSHTQICASCLVNRYTHNCQNCEKEFKSKQSVAAYCSPDCRKTYVYKEIERECIECWQKFMIASNKRSLCCSEKCRKQRLNRIIRDNNRRIRDLKNWV